MVRTHVLRPTWHFVATEDIGWLLELTAPRVRPVIARQLDEVHGLAGAGLDRATSVVLEALTDQPDQTGSSSPNASAARASSRADRC